MRKFLDKVATAIVVFIVFAFFVGLLMVGHQLLIGESYAFDMLIAVVAAVILARSIPRHDESKAKECMVTQLMMYIAMFMPSATAIICYAIGLILFIFTWIMWEKEHKNLHMEIYSRWMVCNLFMLSFIISSGIVLLIRDMIAIPVLVSTTIGLWLVMILRLSSKLK